MTLFACIFLHVNLFVSVYSTGQLSAVEYLTVTVTVTVGRMTSVKLLCTCFHQFCSGTRGLRELSDDMAGGDGVCPVQGSYENCEAVVETPRRS